MKPSLVEMEGHEGCINGLSIYYSVYTALSLPSPTVFQEVPGLIYDLKGSCFFEIWPRIPGIALVTRQEAGGSWANHKTVSPGNNDWSEETACVLN